MTTLKYYYIKDNSISEVIFDKYTIDNCVIVNKKNGKPVKYHKKGRYNKCNVQDNTGKSYAIQIGRAIASTFHGPPPTPTHTADHIDRNSTNDTVENIRWLCKSGQSKNQSRPDTYNSAFVITKDGLEKTAQEWVSHLNSSGKIYTMNTIRTYARVKQHGFSYKEYPDLPGEVWKVVKDSSNERGHWEISNMNRVKNVTKHAENVIEGERLWLDNGYPAIKINKKIRRCHILAFASFFPEEYAKKNMDEIILHDGDDKLDFRPHKLRIGTDSENKSDAHDNGKYGGKKTARMKCASYIYGILEKEHDSQTDAMRYLKSVGFDKASIGKISLAINAFRSGEIITRYGRTWRPL